MANPPPPTKRHRIGDHEFVAAEVPPPKGGRPPSTLHRDALTAMDAMSVDSVLVGEWSAEMVPLLNRRAKADGLAVHFTARNIRRDADGRRRVDVYAVRGAK